MLHHYRLEVEMNWAMNSVRSRDGMAGSVMKGDRKGRRIFCPFGPVGPTYVIPSDEMAAEIARFMKWFNRQCIFVAPTVTWAFGLRFALFFALPLEMTVFFIRSALWVSKMERGDPVMRPSMGETLARIGRLIGYGPIWTMFTLLVVLLALDLLVHVQGREVPALVGAILLITGLAFLVAILVAMRPSKNGERQ